MSIATIRCAAIVIVVGLLPGCRAVSEVVAPRKAIPELPDSGDRPDAPPLGERGNAVFTAASYDDEGKLLVTLPFFGSANMQVWDAQTGALVSSFDGGIPNFQSYNLWMIDSRRQRLLRDLQRQALLGVVAGPPHRGRGVYARHSCTG